MCLNLLSPFHATSFLLWNQRKKRIFTIALVQLEVCFQMFQSETWCVHIVANIRGTLCPRWGVDVSYAVFYRYSVSACIVWYMHIMQPADCKFFLHLHHPTVSVTFLGPPSFHSFARTDIVTTISHEWLEQSRWNLQGIFMSPVEQKDGQGWG